MKKILAITGIRSDYDLMSALYQKLDSDPQVDFRLLVGGAHLSKTYGLSISQIREDGFTILQTIESLIDGDSLSSRLKSASVFLMNSVDIVANWNPDLIIYAGDREEVWIGAMLGAYLDIPTIHFYGGDHTASGYVDNTVRHATSKLSTLHMVTIDEHKERLLKIGEQNSRIHVIGDIALDNFVSCDVLPLDVLSKSIGLPKDFKNYAIVIFHSGPTENDDPGVIFENILMTLKRRSIPACVSFPNTDPGNQKIISIIDRYAKDPLFYFYQNLSRKEFISLYKNSLMIIGNSSSGILESASIPVAAINVGIRQNGRFSSNNVINCDTNCDAIDAAITYALSPDFLQIVKKCINPYGNGHSAEKAYQIIMHTDLHAMRLKSEDVLAGENV